MLGQFLSSALTSICRSAEIAPGMVGTASDVRELIAFRLGYDVGGTPVLAEGWRAEVVGHVIDELLAGKISIRIADPQSEEPLVFEPATDKGRKSEREAKGLTTTSFGRPCASCRRPGRGELVGSAQCRLP